MRKYKINKISDLITEFKSKYKLDLKVNELKIIDLWFEILGESVRKYVPKISVKKNKIYVLILNPSFKNDLIYSKSEIIKSINLQSLNYKISEIIFL